MESEGRTKLTMGRVERTRYGSLSAHSAEGHEVLDSGRPAEGCRAWLDGSRVSAIGKGSADCHLWRSRPSRCSLAGFLLIATLLRWGA